MDPYQSSRHLPADLLPEILSRLPVKSLLRFRCVSKPWLALVDKDANFARLHLKTFKNNSDQTRLFVVQGWIGWKRRWKVRCSDTFKPIPDIIPLTEARKLGNWFPLDSIDGLILQSKPSTIGTRCLRVWNLSIRKFIEIPPLLEPELSTSSVQFQERVVALGYDQIANDYKLVKLLFLEKTLHSVAIYTLGLGTWKTIKFHGNGSSSCFNWHWEVEWMYKVVCFRSNLYFVAKDERRVKGWDLIWFDLSKEVFSSISIPDHPYFRSTEYYWWRLLSVDGGLTVEALTMDLTTHIYQWAVDTEFMCWKKPRFYSLKGFIAHIKKNGDMLTRRNYSVNLEDESGNEKWVERHEVGSYSREREEHKIVVLNFGIILVSCYVESLILHR